MVAASSSREIGVFYKPELSEGLNPNGDVIIRQRNEVREGRRRSTWHLGLP